MLPFILRRLLYMIPVILGVSVCVFLIIHLMPGDPARIMAGIDASDADVRQVRRSLRLDEPLILQYYHFIGRAAVGDFMR